MATITKNLGIATAYGYAKSKGYTGTEEEFAQAMADFADVSAEAETLEPDDEATASYSGGVLSFGIPKGDKGDTGETGATGATGATGNGISSIAKTGTSGLVDTYTITFTDGTTTNFDVTNGAEAIDDTLSIAGRAADAKATGDAVDDLKSETNQLEELCLSLREIHIYTAGTGWKLNNDGSWASASGWNVKQCAVTEGDVIYVKSDYVWKFETGVSTGTIDLHASPFTGFVTVPATATYIAISTPIAENGNNGAYTFENIIDAKLEKERLFPPCEIHEELGLLQDNGQYLYGDTYHSMVTNQIACSEGDVFYYYGFVSIYAVTAMFFNANGSIVSTVKSIGGASGFQHFTITAPSNSASVIFTSYNTLNNVPPLVVTMSAEYHSPLALKKWYACGDSFTYGGYGDTNHRFTEGKYVDRNMVYPYFIGNRTNCNVQNIALDGMTMATHNGDSNNFTNTSNNYNYTTITDDADYVTLYFGINDNGKGVPVGSVDDTEKTTFCGAYNFVLDNLITRLTHGKIGIIVSNEIPQSFADATIAIAKKWGIPYLDLNYDESVPLMSGSLRPTASNEVKALRNTQFRISDANHHPNTVAHEYESYFIEKWLLSL